VCSSQAASFLAHALVLFRVEDLASSALLLRLARVGGLDVNLGRSAPFLRLAFVGICVQKLVGVACWGFWLAVI